jgi:hypothetical protein
MVFTLMDRPVMVAQENRNARQFVLDKRTNKLLEELASYRTGIAAWCS